MNKRIEELRSQAQRYANDYGVDEFGGEDRNKIYIIFTEKFSELLIKECMSLTENCTNSWTQDTGAELISKHFGVE